MADYTRDTFRPSRHFSGVRQQQGRVHLDADWNEAFDISRHVERTSTGDVIGLTGMPGTAPGFALSVVPAAPGVDLLIGVGRAYVGGILVEHETNPASVLHRVSGADAGTVWEIVAGAPLRVEQWIQTVASGAVTHARVTAVLPAEEGDGGRQRIMFSDVISMNDTLEVQGLASLRVQPDLRDLTPEGDPGLYLAYLDVWEREITVLDDPLIAETALNGPDTAVRSQVIWQVKTLPLQPLIDAGAIVAPPSCSAFPPGWTPKPEQPLLLSAAARAAAADQSPCELPVDGGYRSLDNQLYRVEVHTGDPAGVAGITLKWSRDNAIHRHRLLDVANGSLVLDEIGPDSPTSIAGSDWLELCDEERVLGGEPGYFVEVDEVVGTRLGIRTILHPLTLEPLVQNGKPNADVLPKQGTVRRWEGGKPVAIPADGVVSLEAGIEVTVTPGRAATGMSWLIPARTLTAAIEWPADASSGAALALSPHGVRHAYCALGIIDKAAAGLSIVSDCRPIFEPLSELEVFAYLGGDGQEVAPDLTSPATLVALNSPFRVGVTRGRHPVAGRAVRFTLREVGSGASLGLLPGGSEIEHQSTGAAVTTLVMRTNPSGVAEAGLSIPGVAGQYHVTAELLNSAVPAQASPANLPISFTASASVAAAVAFDPGNCAYQSSDKIAPTPAKTVQEAIDRLCPRVELRMIGGDSQLLSNQQESQRPLRVGVYWGKQPLKDVRVAFEVVSGDASVTDGSPLADADGIAETYILAGSDPTQNNGLVEITATVTGTPEPNPAPLTFGARFFKADAGGGPSCTVTIGPDDLAAANATLAEFIGKLFSPDPSARISISLLPGNYVLHETLDLSRFGNLILAGCRDGVWLEPQNGDPSLFQRGLVLIEGTSNLTLRRIGFIIPNRGDDLAQGVWVSKSSDIRIEDCIFRLPAREDASKQLGVRISSECPNLRMLGNRIASDVPFNSGEAKGVFFGIMGGIDGRDGTDKAEAPQLTELEISGNEFENLTAAVYLRGLLGAVRCEDNVVNACENGFFFIAAAMTHREVLFDALDRGADPESDGRVILAAYQGAHPALSLIVQQALASTPLPASLKTSNVAKFGEARSSARSTRVRVSQAKSFNDVLLQRFNAEPALSAEAKERLRSEVALLPSRDSLETAFKALDVSGFRISSSKFPPAAKLRLRGNEITTLPKSGDDRSQQTNCNLLVDLDESTTPSVIVTDNDIRGHRSLYLVWINGGSFGTVTGNIIINLEGEGIDEPLALYYMLNVEAPRKLVSIAGNAIGGSVLALTPSQASSSAPSWRHLNSNAYV